MTLTVARIPARHAHSIALARISIRLARRPSARSNPAFDDFMNRDEVLAMSAAARRMPSREADFRRFTLNQRITVATPFVSPSLWDSCRGRVAPLAELPVLYGGLD